MIERNWQELQKPEKIAVTSSEYNERQAVVSLGPLERGFGTTLGNALRRVLLSSLQGAAVKAIQIQGVVHEFSSVAGVREDVTDLVLNVKGVSVAMSVEGEKKLRLQACRRNFFSPSTDMATDTPFTFRTKSVTSSRTPATEENSCTTP